ncbi:MAG TPA: hypothetical protein VFJ96_11130, partial [Gemmatimonadaceae bacterium]|nr:hypothetical protein [Gemmatimonadaceae bacterium]
MSLPPDSSASPAPPARSTPSRPAMADVDFERASFIVIWEMTQACDLACLHCRASARPMRDQGELTTTEAMR